MNFKEVIASAIIKLSAPLSLLSKPKIKVNSMTLVEVAISQIGMHEDPKGSNWGADVQKYLHSVGIDFPAAWCCGFVYWCAEQSAQSQGKINPLIKTGSVLNLWNAIPVQYKFTTNPQAGDIFIMDFGAGLGHCGIIEAVNWDLFNSIDGNSNDNESREGWEVERKTRKVKSCKGFIRIGLNNTIA